MKRGTVNLINYFVAMGIIMIAVFTNSPWLLIVLFIAPLAFVIGLFLRMYIKNQIEERKYNKRNKHDKNNDTNN